MQKKSKKRIVTVNLPEKYYPVFIGAGERNYFAECFRKYGRGRDFWITDRNIANLWGFQLESLCLHKGAQILVLPPGENQKKLKTVERLCRDLVKLGVERGDTLIACGGGVIGDIVGFTASCYLRGIAYYQMPTTLLAMVDASVGGKTGVDIPEGKNLIGAFHQPAAVIADVEFLDTLDQRELRSGFAEVLKAALIGDSALFDYIRSTTGELFPLKNKEKTIQWVESCIKYKAMIVSQDERESDARRLLNFGHTIGHALEVSGNYKLLKHGEAVYWGMLTAISLSVEIGLMKPKTAEKIYPVLSPLIREIPAIGFDNDEIYKIIQRDKKMKSGKPNFVLLKDISQPVITDQVTRRQIEAALRHLQGWMKISKKS